MNDDTPPSGSKRTRASGDVLEYLLREFARNQKPPPDHRKSIAAHTGMSEKAVRIWFQNRRAKLRKVEKMKGTDSTDNSQSGAINANTTNGAGAHLTSASLAVHSDSSVDINGKYSLIDCSSLSVGLWQRVKTGSFDIDLMKQSFVNLSPHVVNSMMGDGDLLVILSRKNYEVNYFFSAITNNSKILFRIFYPVSSVVQCSVLNNHMGSAKTSCELRVVLSQQPKFSVYFFNRNHASTNQWSICDDFSEGQQVSQAVTSGSRSASDTTPHVLVGSKSSLQYLNAFISENNQVLAQTVARGLSQVHMDPPAVAAPSAPSMAPLAAYDDILGLWDSGAGAGHMPPPELTSASAPSSTTNATAAPSDSDTPNFGTMILHGSTADDIAANLDYSPMLAMDDNISPQSHQSTLAPAPMGSGGFEASPDTPEFLAFDPPSAGSAPASESPSVGQLDPLAAVTALPAYTHTGSSTSGDYQAVDVELDMAPVAAMESESNATATNNIDSFIDFGGY
ncbi:hypothetical protein DIURU_005378 [Diutina rugosa]|uniref:Homeobox domain-containing protein n=1 Tax=Diutina rugosa TaxID=5481 RepID=A0A642UDG7_DIURU|nr:uncharacterized protein DIURU_005378 [Diutina rugosa]KAA8897145.1 hypothetical protein DIURU_005378 [Diutina rugosa]